MRTAIRRMGNSQGVLIPKPLLAQVGLDREAEMTVEHGALVLRRPRGAVREGWAQAARGLAEAGDDKPVWPELRNAGDKDIEW